MNKKRIFLLLIMLSVVMGVYAQMDIELQNLVASREGTHRRYLAKRSQHLENENSVVVIAQLEKGARVQKDALRQIGVKVKGDYGRVAVLSVPISKLRSVAEMDGMEFLSTDHKHKLMNYVTREETQVNLLQLGNWETVNSKWLNGKCFDGTGVIVGIVDSGIDFNHAAFRDENGNTRIKMLQIYDMEKGGEFPEDMNDVRRTYTDPEEIALLETDDISLSHGSHTLATAAGSPVVLTQGLTLANMYTQGMTILGMAPKADIVVAALHPGEDGEIYESYCIDAIYNQMEYAKKVGKPIVINNSYGELSTFCDGKSSMAAFEESVAGPGRIMCFASANSNNQAQCIECTPTSDTDTIRTILYDEYNDYYDGGAEAYVVNEDGTPIDVQLIMVNANSVSNMKPVKRWKYYSYKDSCYLNVEDVMTVGNESLHDNRYAAKIKLPPGYAYSLSGFYYVSIQVVGQKGKKFRIVMPDGMLLNFEDKAYTRGTGINSFSIDCESDSVISVGSYVSRTEGRLWDKRPIGTTDTPLHHPSSFSSYGTMTSGKNIPDVLAPGQVILSAYNAYDTYSIKDGQIIDYVHGYSDQFGRKSYYGWMSGTSMATPVVTGIVALWLQANPNLSVSDVRDVLYNSSEYYPETTDYPKEALGSGYIKAANGLEYILEKATGIEDAVAVGSLQLEVGSIYNLAGQRVDEGYKGIIIKNGKKILQK